MAAGQVRPVLSRTAISQVRHVEIAGAVMVIETFSGGRILVNGDPSEPKQATVDAFHYLNANPTNQKG
jgi:hypothetical protein